MYLISSFQQIVESLSGHPGTHNIYSQSLVARTVPMRGNLLSYELGQRCFRVVWWGKLPSGEDDFLFNGETGYVYALGKRVDIQAVPLEKGSIAVLLGFFSVNHPMQDTGHLNTGRKLFDGRMNRDRKLDVCKRAPPTIRILAKD